MIDYFVLFGWSFLAATILPLASEVALVSVVRSHDAVLIPVSIATAGNYLGACTTYWLARQTARRFAPDPIPGGRLRKARMLLARFGQPALLLSWVPLLGDAIVAVAGGVRLPFISFSVWVTVGKAARYFVVAWIASNV